MRDKESKIRFTKSDLEKETAGQTKAGGKRPKPRPPSGEKLRVAGQEVKNTETMKVENAAVPEVEIPDAGQTPEVSDTGRSVEGNVPKKVGSEKLRFKSTGAEKYEQSMERKADMSESRNNPAKSEDVKGNRVKASTGSTAKTADNAAKTSPQKSPGTKLRTEKEAARAQSGKLRFESSDVDSVSLEKTGRHFRPVQAAETAVSGTLHARTAEYEDDNVGVEALNETEGMAETGVRKVTSGHYGRKLRHSDSTEKPEVSMTYGESTGSGQRAGLSGSPAGEAYNKGTSGAAGKMTGTAGESGKAGEAASANPISRWRQRQAIKKEYAAARAGKATGTAGGSAAAGSHAAGGGKAAESAGKATKKVKDVGEKVFAVVKDHPMGILLGGMIAIVILVIASSLSSCSAMLSGSGNAVLATSFTATDEDILGAEADYCAMEEELRERIRQIEEDNPDYDEYEIDTGEINHNPYELAALLTVLYEDYTREEVQRTLREIFEAQYEYSTSHRTETVTETRQVRVGESLGQVVTSGYCNCPICCGRWSGGPTASGVYPTAEHTIAVDASNPFVPMGTKVVMNGVEYTVEDTGNFDRYGVQFDVYYDSHWAATLHGHKTWEAYIADDNGANVVEVTRTETKRILTVEVTNHTLNSVVEAWGLTNEQMERYRILVAQRGNRDYLFADNIYANPTEILHYDIPGEALSDVRFARMINEAEKYLGYPYVWGGASPSTSFDCSGFVSWVINHCGNGWNYGRLTAEGLRNVCAIIPRSEAKPGDLIFFQGTYDTSGASHVGIYVGNGMMIHCGNPIQYASIDTSYWQAHFYCFGRLP